MIRTVERVARRQALERSGTPSPAGKETVNSGDGIEVCRRDRI